MNIVENMIFTEVILIEIIHNSIQGLCILRFPNNLYPMKVMIEYGWLAVNRLQTKKVQSSKSAKEERCKESRSKIQSK